MYRIIAGESARSEHTFMNKVKLRLVTLIGFLVLFALLMGLGFGALVPKRARAVTTYDPSSLFWSRTGGDVAAYKQNAEAEKAYTTFVFSDGGTVEYHRNLALKWFEKDTEVSETSLANPGKAAYFNLQFTFGNIHFTKFTIEFQSAEENITKDGKSVNTVIFEKTEEGVKAYLQNASQQKDEEFSSSTDGVNIVGLNGSENVVLSLTDGAVDGQGVPEAGEFHVLLNEQYLGTFTNIGNNFLQYRTSGTATTPMIFKAELTDDAKQSGQQQKVFMTSLNGQTLEVQDGTPASTADGDNSVRVTGGKVHDDTPAVLVLNEKVYPFMLGQRFSLDYEAVDVCYDQPVVRRSFYMLKKDGENYVTPDESKDSEDYATLSTNNYFMPPTDKNSAEEEYVSIRFTLDDDRDTAEEEFIYLTWYADLDVTYGEGLNGGDGVVRTFSNNAAEEPKSMDYILVNRERKGPTFTVLTATAADPEVAESKASNAIDDPQNFVQEYQDKLDEIASDEKVSTGNGAYFYLPSLRNLIKSDYADYRNLRFSIYYKKPIASTTASSETSLRYNNLRFQIDTEGMYRFRVIASDANSNAMEYYNEDGELVTVNADNVWDIEGIPEFTFTVEYRGATIEPAGEQSIGYRGSNYSITDFEIVDGGNTEKKYSLWYLDRSLLPENTEIPSYSELVENTETYFTGSLHNGFREIRVFNSEIEEGDDAWDDTDNDYAWDPDSSLSFTPQESGFYVVRLIHTDNDYNAGAQKTVYQVIEVRNPIDYIPGENNWFKENVTSVVLFSISAVLAVIIVILFVVKPSDKNVEDVDLEKLKGKKAKKNTK